MRHRTTIRRTSTIVALLGFLACPCARAGEIVSSGVHAGIVYLLTANPPRVARFDLVAAAWKPSVPVPVGPTALAVGDAGIFVASGRSIARFTLEGTGETHVANLLAPVTTMVVGQRLYVLAAGLLSAVDPASGAVVPVYDIPFFPSLAFKGLALSTERHWLIGLGGSELSRFALAPDGVVIEPPLRAATNGMTATRLTVFPGEARVADDAGLVYHTNDLSSASPVRRDPITFVDPVPLGGPYDDLAFYGDLPIVLRAQRLVAYDRGFRVIGEHELAAPAQRLAVGGDMLFAFTATDGDPTVTAVAVSALGTLVPYQPLDPVGLAWTPDAAVQATDGTIHLLSRATLSLFRWSPATESYGPTYTFAEAPQYMAYAATTNRLYFAYPDGRVTTLALDGSLVEAPFVSLLDAPCGLTGAGDLVFACGVSAGIRTHRVYGGDGTLRSSAMRFDDGTEYAWSAATRRIYYSRYSFFYAEPIGVDGTIGDEVQSPSSGAGGPPIRVAPDGSRVFTSSGTIVDGTTLEFAAYVPASGIRDASWAGSVLHTIRSFDLFAYPPQELETELEVWTGGPTLDRQRQIRLPGTPLRVFTGGAAPVVVTHVRNVPRIAVVHCGNGLADGAEACDGADLRGMTCAGLGLGNGALACTSSCTLDTAGCGAPPFCGDHVVNAPNELCDGADLGTVAGLYGCDLFGLPSGSLACSADCLRLEPTACSHCGDGAVFGGGVFPGVPGSEQCDGDDLAGQTCVSLHFTGGTLSCRADCSLDTSACLPDCTTTRCDDGDPCTADVCEPDRGCVGIAIADCQTVFGYSVQRYTLPDYGAKGVCRVTCRSDYRGGLVFGTDDTFEIPETPFACWDGEQLVVVPSEAGSLVSRRKGREGMRATNTGARNEVLDSCDVDLAFGRPGGWVKRTDGVVVEGRHREMVVDRSSGRPRRFRIDSRFAGPGRTVPLSGRVKALPDCAQDPETLCRH